MKRNTYFKHLTLALCLAASAAAGAQTPKKPRMQTSASAEEIVYKPKGQTDNKKEEKKQPETTDTKKKNIPAGKRYWALKTNVAYDIFAIHNLAVEVQCNSRISVEVPVMWSLWDIEREHGIRGVAVQPEARWWMGESVGKGHYFGIHAHVAWFNVKWEENRYQTAGRPLMGAGLSYGYKLPLSDHWGAEFSLGLGYANMKYDTYYNIENGAKLDTRNRHYWGPTRVAASLVYRF